MQTDPLSNLIVALKNAALAGRATAVVPASIFKDKVAEKLKAVGYLRNIIRRGKKVKKFLELELVYLGKQAKLKEIKRVSRPGQRVYHAVSEIKSIRQGTGLAIYSTPLGILTGEEARKAKVGGEILFKIW